MATDAEVRAFNNVRDKLAETQADLRVWIARVERVRALHVQIVDNTAPKLGFDAPDMCRADGETWPCPTIAALDGAACGPDCNPATCVHMYDEHFPGEHLDDCSGCRCCPAEACEPGEPRGPGVCGYTCPCHPDFFREDR